MADIGGSFYGRAMQRNNTVAGLAAANPVPALGEFVVAYDGTTPVVKVGDGVRAWNDLPALSEGGTGGTVTSIDGGDADSLGGIVIGDGGGSVDTAYLLNRGNHTWVQAQSTVVNLVEDLAAKAPKASPTFTGTVSGVSKAMVGLPNVDNTADANKPVSTAQASAITAAKDRANHTGQMTVAGIDSEAAADGQVLTADGGGNALWASLSATVAAVVAALPPTPLKFSAPVATTGPSATDRAYVARTIKEVHMRCQGAPVGSDLVVPVQSFASGTWTTVATATIAAGSTTAYANTSLSYAQAVGNLLRVNPSSVGTTAATGVALDVVFG